jgi:2-haloacid dehalogenase
MGGPGLIVFDVNETLLSLEPIRRNLESIFGAGPPIGEWFARLLHGSLVANTLDAYRPFDELAAEALIYLAARRGLLVRAEDAVAAVDMTALPPHHDVVEGMGRLAAAGIPVVALTNGSTPVAKAQIENAGLAGLLNRVISVDEVGRFKPDPAPYHHVSESMGVPLDAVVMVAAHDWDCAGAMTAGTDAIFLRRPGSLWGLPTPPPDKQVPDLLGLAAALGV